MPGPGRCGAMASRKQPEGPWNADGSLRLETMPAMDELHFFYWYCFHAGITRDMINGQPGV
jgi:hypothetical protein